MKNTELEPEVHEFSEKVAKLGKNDNVDMLFYESGIILQKFIFVGEIDTKLYEEFADIRYTVYSRKKSAICAGKTDK